MALIILFIVIFILFLPSIFIAWSNMDYVRHLEDMGVFVDENGREI